MIDLFAALTHFKKTDPIIAHCLESALESHKPIQLPKKMQPSEYTFSLYSSIISQQISIKAADAILKRFLELIGDPHDARNILVHDIEGLRSIGLSRQKASYIQSIAELTSNGTVQIDHLDSLTDHEIIAELTLIKGVGRWTAEMFLMFTLARQDIFSIGDLGLLNAAKKLYQKPDMTKIELETLSDSWSPHRTSAALALWHSLDNK